MKLHETVAWLLLDFCFLSSASVPLLIKSIGFTGVRVPLIWTLPGCSYSAILAFVSVLCHWNVLLPGVSGRMRTIPSFWGTVSQGAWQGGGGHVLQHLGWFVSQECWGLISWRRKNRVMLIRVLPLSNVFNFFLLQNHLRCFVAVEHKYSVWPEEFYT